MATLLSCLYTNIYAGETLQFSDESDDAPATWHWERNSGGGWADFAGTPTNENPTETFSTAGTYSIRLTTDKGTVTKTNFITVAATPSTDYYPTDDTATNTDHDPIPNLTKASEVTVLLDSGTTVNASSLTLSDDDVIGICYGTTLVWDLNSTTRLKGVGVAGVLKFSRATNTKMMVQHLYVYKEGILDRGTVYDPIDSVTSEIVGLDEPLETGTVDSLGRDPRQYGNGLIVFGRYRSHGKAINKSFIRLATAPSASDTSLSVTTAMSDWAVNDVVVIPESRQYTEAQKFSGISHQWEQRSISSNSGTTIGLSSALTYDHPGAGENSTLLYPGTPLNPHVANVTRNVKIRSEDGTGVRWHTLYTHRADIDVRYTEHDAMGRTSNAFLNRTLVDYAATSTTNESPIKVYHGEGLYNDLWVRKTGDTVKLSGVTGNTNANGTHVITVVNDYTFTLDGTTGNGAPGGTPLVTVIGSNEKGRYCVHVHHCYGPIGGQANGHAWTMIGNSFYDMLPAPGGNTLPASKWFATVHGSSFGLFRNNVIHHAAGAGFQTEDGSEYHNLIDANISMNNIGDRSPRELIGHSGSGFMFAGVENYVTNNVGAGNVGTYSQIVCGQGFDIGLSPTGDNVTTPDFVGADPMDDGDTHNTRSVAMLQFEGNESYGGAVGLTVWHISSENGPTSTVEDLLVWHSYEQGFFGYPTWHLGFDGFEAVKPGSYGITWGDYRCHAAFCDDFSFRKCSISGIGPLHDPRGTIIFSNGEANAKLQSIEIVTPATPGTTETIGDHELQFNNVLCTQYLADAGYKKLSTVYSLVNGNTQLRPKHVVKVTDFDQVSGDDFQVYVVEQADDAVMQHTSGGVSGCPESGLTNAQAYVKYHQDGTLKTPTGTLSDSEGCCLFGQIMPDSATTRATINGRIVLESSGTNTPIAKSWLALAVGTGRLMIGVG